ncbi:MAG: hypothetical protein K6E71_05110 [Lachnospiraceae bacterium]|nr:hypothetical protein [Lachnospiraceae bacterium]
MRKYQVKIKLLTETMPGSGMAVPGTIDSDIRHDTYGLPYMNAKTFKGHVREQMEFLCTYDSKYDGIDINSLLGSNDLESVKKNARLKFTKVELSEVVQQTIRAAVDAGDVTKTEILDALTVTYTRTKIGEKGVAEPHSLRKERELRRGLIMETAIYAEELSETEEDLLKDTIAAIKHIGMHKSKGKGVVACSIAQAGQE